MGACVYVQVHSALCFWPAWNITQTSRSCLHWSTSSLLPTPTVSLGSSPALNLLGMWCVCVCVCKFTCLQLIGYVVCVLFCVYMHVTFIVVCMCMRASSPALIFISVCVCASSPALSFISVCVCNFTCLKLYKCVCVSSPALSFISVCVCASSPALCFWGLWSVFVNCFVFSVSGCCCFLSVFFNTFFLEGTAFKLRIYAERESLVIALEKKKHSRKK